MTKTKKKQVLEECMENLCWNVYYHSMSGKEIKPLNVFRHRGFSNDVIKAALNYSTREEFEDEIRKSLSYYYHFKAEWEIIISPWCGSAEDISIKTDVYNQIMLNREHFMNYLYSALYNQIHMEESEE